MHIGAAQLFRADFFAGRGFDQRRVPLTMIVSSLIAGTYAPPAVQEPITAAICGMRAALIRAWL